MPETTLKILLSELQTVRLVCQGTVGGKPCRTTLEVPIERLATIANQGGRECPVCKTAFGVFPINGATQDGFGPLAEAIRNLVAVKDRVVIEFTIPQKD
jgi:hypothetical protein